MSDPSIIAWLDQEDARLAQTIRRCGWAIEYVGGGQCSVPGCDCSGDGDGPPFAYTVGLFGLDHPELLIFGVPPETACGVLNTVGDRVRLGGAVAPGDLITFAEWQHRIIAEPVPNPGDVVLGANRFYRRSPKRSVPVRQLSYDDPEGRFPWEPGYAAPELQPRPGTFSA